MHLTRLAWYLLGGHLLSLVIPQMVPAPAPISSFSTQILAKLGAAPAATEESSISQHQPGEGTFPRYPPTSWGETSTGDSKDES